ncbi:NAD(P)H-dependent FMN reductase [Streptomyces sp. DvalAA-14]|uniref:NADPH-dependent FMN reductase n=1 Tax=unclassified Streptomyces TaxID=2593676 RepID=UPI00081B941B|nr:MULTISPECIES: NAD(P)H-dependent oxidoreductase [unclassified Streptomyces]MYS24998.1 NADPH-dependent FMN reductase [Streptomyces sp. SID4948]SCE51250.1 NAD(P)H-dependent FMN reductase [Streptomyces sp. DvalAA-14]
MSKLGIIVASTRPGRVGLPVAQWFEGEARTHAGFAEIELIDLAEVALPFMNEPNHPRLARYTHQHTRDWSALVSGVDAFVFVMPEYNHGFNAELKNAIDYLHNEWLYKPVGFVTYGGVAAGTRALQMIKQVIGALKMTPVLEAVNLPFVHQFLDEEEGLLPNEIMTAAAKSMLDELVRLEDNLRPLRPTLEAPHGA